MQIPNLLRIPLVKSFKRLGIPVNQKWIKRFGTPAVITVAVNPKKKFRMKGTNLNLENRLYWRGFKAGHEPATAQTFALYASNANWVIDVGANTGFFALIAKTMNPSANVAAFEPHPFFYGILEENARLNNYKIITKNEAASNNTGTVNFFFPRPNEGNVYSGTVNMDHFNHHQSTRPNTIDIKTSPLDTLIANEGWTKGGLVKIDAEGHDEEVLLGMRNAISQYQPILIVEIQSDTKARSIAGLDFLNGYTFYGIKDKEGGITGVLDIPYDINCNNYLFLPSKIA